MTDPIRYGAVDRRRDLSLREFKRDYFNPGRPVIMEGAIDHWKARFSWTFEGFRSRFQNTMVEAHRYEQGRYRPDNIQRLCLSDYIGKILANDWDAFPYYLRDNWSLFVKHKDLLNDFSHPKYFFDWFRLIPGFMRRPGLRIFIGPKGAITNMHTDIWGTHFWMAQLEGRKRWILFSPDQRDFLYKNCWQVRPDNPDLERFPLFAKAKGLDCTVGPGDMIFLPSKWVHWVISLDPTISLTYNFMGSGLFPFVSQGLYARVCARADQGRFAEAPGFGDPSPGLSEDVPSSAVAGFKYGCLIMRLS